MCMHLTFKNNDKVGVSVVNLLCNGNPMDLTERDRLLDVFADGDNLIEVQGAGFNLSFCTGDLLGFTL